MEVKKKQADATDFILEKVKIERAKMSEMVGLKLFNIIYPLLQCYTKW